MRATQEFHSLLLSMFSAEEFVRFVRWGANGSEILASVNTRESPRAVMEALVEQLERRGMLDDRLFQRLEEERPGRMSEIRDVQSRMLKANEPAAPLPRASAAEAVRARPGGVDVLVAVALPLEADAVLGLLNGDEHELELRDGTIVSVKQLDAGPIAVGVVLTTAGNLSAALVVSSALRELAPRAVAFVGVAGGVHPDVQLGDVIVATKVYGYEYGKDRSDLAGGFLPRPEVGNTAYRFVQRGIAEARKRDWLARLGDPPAERAPVVHVRAIAAGEKVVEEGSVVAERIRRFYSDAYAVEMEGLGLHRAADQVGTPAFVVRGISDLLVKSDNADRRWQPIAARNAAAFALQVLAKVTT